MIKRYFLSESSDEPFMDEDKAGDYVDYDDYAKLEAEVERLRLTMRMGVYYNIHRGCWSVL